MKTEKKILIISGDLLKHKFVALKILKKFKNSQVIFEKYPKKIERNYTKNKSKIIKDHFNEVTRYEKIFFNKFCNNNRSFLKKRTIFSISKGQINENSVFNKIRLYKPYLIILNATSILGKKYTNFFKKVVNIHAGLIPYYRGTGCNVWTFYNDELEYTGVTIHFVNNKIDHGNIIIQEKTLFSNNDNTHTVGCKNSIIASKLILKSVKYLLKHDNYLGKRILSKKTKLYQNKDFNENILLKVNENIKKKGIVKKYNNNKKKIKLINFNRVKYE